MEGETEAVAELAVEELEVAYVFDYDPTGADAWVAADEEFVQYFAEKYPNYVVVREQTPWTGFTEKLLTSIAGGSRYDVIYGYWQWLPLFIENDVVGPLDDLIDADTTIAADDFFDYAKETVEGDTYGLAWFISGWLHWYNMTAVNEAGYTTPKEMNENGEWDYDAWFQFATDFTSREGDVPIYGYDMASARGVSVYAMLAWAWGTQQWSDDFATSLMNSRENVALWKWIRQFYRDGLTPLPRDRTPDRPLSFTNGRAMATMAGQWYTRNIVQDGAPDLFDIGMAPFPKGPSGQYSVAALNSFYFSKSPGNVDPAWAWYKERSFSEAAASIYAKIGGGRFPSIKRVAQPPSTNGRMPRSTRPSVRGCAPIEQAPRSRNGSTPCGIRPGMRWSWGGVRSRRFWASSPKNRRISSTHSRGVRASVLFFLLKEEIDLLAEAVRSLAESRRQAACDPFRDACSGFCLRCLNARPERTHTFVCAAYFVSLATINCV